jgi:RNA polymerase sigma-70 factor, ECF subfamily
MEMNGAHQLGQLYREQYAQVLAPMIRRLRSFDQAEEVVQAAFEAAWEQWPTDGWPQKPVAWLHRVARNKAVDRWRRQRWLLKKEQEISFEWEEQLMQPAMDEHLEEHAWNDDLLRLMFTCCHPLLAQEAQVALCLKTLGGLTTDEIARAFLVQSATMAQRLVRAKERIRKEQIPYEVPDSRQHAERLRSVQTTIYLIFNEGYAATHGEDWLRAELCQEAIRLARLVVRLVPQDSESKALLALLLLHDARRPARLDAEGDLVLLEHQDRTRWEQASMIEGRNVVEQVLSAGPPGPYALQAAIAAVHSLATRCEDTDWLQICGLYQRLLRQQGTPVVWLNYAAALAMAKGPEAAFPLLDSLENQGKLSEYHLLPAARADLLRRMGKAEQAAHAYRKALKLVNNQSERRYLEKRLQEMLASPSAS